MKLILSISIYSHSQKCNVNKGFFTSRVFTSVWPIIWMCFEVIIEAWLVTQCLPTYFTNLRNNVSAILFFADFTDTVSKWRRWKLKWSIFSLIEYCIALTSHASQTVLGCFQRLLFDCTCCIWYILSQDAEIAHVLQSQWETARNECKRHRYTDSSNGTRACAYWKLS